MPPTRWSPSSAPRIRDDALVWSVAESPHPLSLSRGRGRTTPFSLAEKGWGLWESPCFAEGGGAALSAVRRHVARDTAREDRVLMNGQGMIETDRLIAPGPARRPGRGARARAASPAARRVRGPGKDPRSAVDLHRGRAAPEGSARPRAAVRAAGPGQDHARAHHRARDGREPAADLGAGARARGRPRGAAHEPRAQRRPVHRRDPPALAGGRRDALSGARGLPDRHHDRRRSGGALGEARPAAVHAGGRDDARGDAHQSAARPLRHRVAARVLHARGAHAHRAALRRGCSKWRSRTTARSRSPRARAARPASPIGCCGACAITRR